MNDAARTLLWLAADLDRRGYAFSGVLRQIARQLATSPPPAADADGCRRCGAAIERLTRGRPRLYCRDCSPPRRKTPEKSTVNPAA